MSEGLHKLSEREKQTLRLLSSGHDIKSVAGHLGLSPHTVNERLREARRKLGVSSSRQAARLLAAAETPSFVGPAETGVDRPVTKPEASPVSSAGGRTPGPLAWLGGGMLIMSLIVAVVILAAGLHPLGQPNSNPPARVVAVSTAGPAEPESGPAARAWVALLDQQRWADSWTAAGTLFKSKLAQDGWAAQVQAVRQPLGSMSARRLLDVTKASSLPGVPDGEYQILQFMTDFEHKRGAVETVILAHEGASWRVDGYFIR